MRLDKNSLVKEAARPGSRMQNSSLGAFCEPQQSCSAYTRPTDTRCRYRIRAENEIFEWKTRTAAITSPRRFRSRARTMSQ